VTEPIRRILGPRTGIDAAVAIDRLAPVERRPPREEPEPRRRRPANAPRAGRAGTGDDGRPHVDVQA
jgi:hypothetical protein